MTSSTIITLLFIGSVILILLMMGLFFKEAGKTFALCWCLILIVLCIVVAIMGWQQAKPIIWPHLLYMFAAACCGAVFIWWGGYDRIFQKKA